MSTRQEVFPLSHIPRLNMMKDMPEKHCVRAYRAHSEAVYLQIRMENRYVTAALTLQEAADIGRQLIDAAAQS